MGRSTLDGEERRRSALDVEEGGRSILSNEQTKPHQLAVDRCGKFNVFWKEHRRPAASSVGMPVKSGWESLTNRSSFGGDICTHGAPEGEDSNPNQGPPGSSKQGQAGTKQISSGPGPGDQHS